MSVQNFTDLSKHYGHEVVVAVYTDSKGKVQNVAIECTECNDVLLDFDSTDEINNKVCKYCGVPATVYAVDTCLGGWAGHFCNDHIPAGYEITDRLDNQKDKTSI